MPSKLSENEILLVRDNRNELRKNSVLKIDRIVTAKAQDVIARIGELSESDSEKFKQKFKRLID
ncbi:MAG: hypothetical protein WKF71_13505 [Pyrinomonadaceae bacterium]